MKHPFFNNTPLVKWLTVIRGASFGVVMTGLMEIVPATLTAIRSLIAALVLMLPCRVLMHGARACGFGVI